MKTQTAAKTTQGFVVKGFITLPINAKKKFDGSAIIRLEADLIVGNKSHFLLTDEEIKVTIDAENKATLHMPVEFYTKAKSANAAIKYAESILVGIEKASGNFTTAMLKTRKFTSTNVVVTWISAEENVLD